MRIGAKCQGPHFRKGCGINSSCGPSFDLLGGTIALRVALAKTSSCLQGEPVLGVIFLLHATNWYDAARIEIESHQATGKMPRRAPIKADFLKRRALMMPKEARYDEILRTPKGSNLGAALVEAMNVRNRASPATRDLGRDLLPIPHPGSTAFWRSSMCANRGS